jgi:FAD/FMN-containing dehydrogenase/Fe-S oxidoreductase
MFPEPQALPDFFADLRGQIRSEIRTDDYTKILYSTDASLYRAMPYGVVFPSTPDDVQAVVATAARYQIPLLARASGSSLAGQAVNEAVVMDFSRHLDRILELNVEERWVRVQPGLVLDHLNAYLKPHRLQFGPDPASSNRAGMGGIVSNNSTGSHSILYGMTADHVLGMTAILSDGSAVALKDIPAAQLPYYQARPGLEGHIYRQLGDLVQAEAPTIKAGTPRHWRRCGGYNLDRLLPDGGSILYPHEQHFNLARVICGAEGSLAVMSDITLNLVPLPKMTALGIVQFDSLYQALAATSSILETGPSAVELLDNLGLTMCREVPAYARLLGTFLEGEPHCILITEYYGESEAELRAKLENLSRHLKAQGVPTTGVIPALSPQQQQNVWTVRKVGLGLMMSVKGDHKPVPFIEDAAVPVEHLAEYVTQVEDFCADLGVAVAYYAHASAGCIHIRPLVNTKDAAEIAKMPQITAFTVELLHAYGGALSSEHGDGRSRSWMNERFFGPELYRVYQAAKSIFDPHNLLNPGMVVNAPPMTQNLRYGAEYAVIPLPSILDFSAEGNLQQAVEMCNGAAVCRKMSGTMCPSFMVTRDEEHSTRGRANALRAAMSGVLPVAEFTSPRMYQVMDLCIGCKACKAECPSSVDMAKIKTEFLARYHQVHGTPLSARVFGHIAAISRLSSGPAAPLINAFNRSYLVREGLEKTLGISRHRTPPAFARQSFAAWFKARPKSSPPQQKGQVVLLADTFTNYNYPHVGQAAVDVLEAAGLEVILGEITCCGRPMISKGLVKEAKQAARRTVAELVPYIEAGLPIVGLEPSCLLSLRDEYSYLADHPQTGDLAALALTFEEFIARLAAENRLDWRLTPEPRRVLLHGHCHQKALVGTGPSKQVLGLPPNYTVQEVDSGCCGMAGSFGYEADHYEVSMQMAERQLLPAVRASGPETLIAAAGVSCRQQIKHGAGRGALHPAEVLRGALLKD